MLQTRVMPSLLLEDGGLVKTISFSDSTYIGDAINSVRIYNELEVDELVVLDIDAAKNDRGPDFEQIAELTSECFMPFTYGGGVKSFDDAQKLFDIGVEKVALNTAAIENSDLLEKISSVYGSQAVVVSVDVKKTFFSGQRVFTKGGRKKTKLSPVEWAKKLEILGAGEILLNSIDNDGKMEGFDLDLIKEVSSAVNIPVVAVGGAGTIEDIVKAKQNGASAIALGSMAVYQNNNRGILINFPTQKQLRSALGER